MGFSRLSAFSYQRSAIMRTGGVVLQWLGEAMFVLSFEENGK